MAEELDAGDIIHQKALNVQVSDTAETLYKKILDLEFETFIEAWPLLITFETPRLKQNLSAGTSHMKKELFSSSIQELNLKENYLLENLLQRLRGLTTNKIEEAAYFYSDGKKYRIQIKISEDEK